MYRLSAPQRRRFTSDAPQYDRTASGIQRQDAAITRAMQRQRGTHRPLSTRRAKSVCQSRGGSTAAMQTPGGAAVIAQYHPEQPSAVQRNPIRCGNQPVGGPTKPVGTGPLHQNARVLAPGQTLQKTNAAPAQLTDEMLFSKRVLQMHSSTGRKQGYTGRQYTDVHNGLIELLIMPASAQHPTQLKRRAGRTPGWPGCCLRFRRQISRGFGCGEDVKREGEMNYKNQSARLRVKPGHTTGVL